MIRIFPQIHSQKKWGGLLLLIAQLLVALISNNASADTRGVNPMIESEFDQHMLRLELAESQLVEAKQLFLTYQSERKAVDAARKNITAWSVNHQPFGNYAEIKDIIHESNVTFDSAYEQWDVIIRDLEDRYFAGLKALAPNKEDLLASICRARVRLSMLDDEHISRQWCYGAHLDLISEIEGIATDNEVIRELLQEYEYLMQSELEQFAKAIILTDKDGTPFVDAMNNAVEQFGIDGAKAEINVLVMIKAQIGIALSRIRSLNESTINKLLSILPVEESQRFRSKVYPELYPFAYKDLKPIALYRRAVNLKDLTAEQRKAIERLRDEFLTRRDRELVALALVYRQAVGEDSILARYRSMVMRRVTKGQTLLKESEETLAFNSALDQWRSIEAQYTTRINSILTTKQKNRTK